MVLEFIQYFEAGKHSIEFAIAQAFPGVISTSFAMISSGDTNQVITGLLTLLGISYMLWRGAWKIVAKVLWRQLNIA